MSSLRLVRLILATAVVASGSISLPAPAAAASVLPIPVIPGTSTRDAEKLGDYMKDGSVDILPSSTFLASPPLGDPAGYSFGSIAGFGTSYVSVLSTGNVGDIPNPAELGSTNLSGGELAGRGSTVRDATIVRLDFTAGATANCLKFDYKFFSKEVPRNVGGPYNDAFVAELDGTTWYTTSGSAIQAPGNIAYDGAWALPSVNNTGSSMTAANAAGTVFDGSNTTGDLNGGATGALTAMKPLAPGGGVHSLYLSLFDQVSYGGDSAVVLDNLRAITVEDPVAECSPPPPPPGGGGGGGFSPGFGGSFGPSAGGKLTLAAEVAGSASPAAWILTATGPTALRGITGAAGVTGVDVTPGTYLLAASGGAATYATSWSCAGGTLVGRSVTVAAGARVACSLRAVDVAPYLGAGTFVIADRNAKVGATVTYWSASWSSRNRPSKGTTVREFRGYAATAASIPPRVGGSWRTSATASGRPPRTLPRLIAVVVTSSVRKSGTRISGNVVRIVLVRRGATFGVGTVVSVLSR